MCDSQAALTSEHRLQIAVGYLELRFATNTYADSTIERLPGYTLCPLRKTANPSEAAGVSYSAVRPFGKEKVADRDCNNMAPSISMREWIRWLPAPESEPTNTLVLTSAQNYYVDIRVLRESPERETAAIRDSASILLLDHIFAAGYGRCGEGDANHLQMYCTSGNSTGRLQGLAAQMSGATRPPAKYYARGGSIGSTRTRCMERT